VRKSILEERVETMECHCDLAEHDLQRLRACMEQLHFEMAKMLRAGMDDGSQAAMEAAFEHVIRLLTTDIEQAGTA
jgi:hypothetical protein